MHCIKERAAGEDFMRALELLPRNVAGACTHLFSQSLDLIPQLRQQTVLLLRQEAPPGLLLQPLQTHYLVLAELHDHFIRLNKLFLFEGEVF